jgi:hypothetical protein
VAGAARLPSAPRTGSGFSRRLVVSFPGGLLLLSPPLDAAAVADPDSHSLLITGPLDALAGFQASFSDCSSRRVASARCTAGRRAGVPVPSRCEDSEALASTDRSEEPSCGSPTLGAFSRELRRVPAGAGHGRRAILLLRAGLAVVGVGRDPRRATSPDDMRTQDVPTPSLDRDTRADTEHLSVRVVDVPLQPAVTSPHPTSKPAPATSSCPRAERAAGGRLRRARGSRRGSREQRRERRSSCRRGGSTSRRP